MVITIENPTAEAAYEALRQLPNEELNRLGDMFVQARFGEGFQSFWTDEDLKEVSGSVATAIDERFGPEEGNYD